MASLNWTESPDGVTFMVQVVARARRDEIVGVEADALKVKVNAPPVEGKANAALINLLAKRLGVKRSDVEIVRGESARRKLLKVRGVNVRRLKEVLGMPGRGDVSL